MTTTFGIPLASLMNSPRRMKEKQQKATEEAQRRYNALPTLEAMKKHIERDLLIIQAESAGYEGCNVAMITINGK